MLPARLLMVLASVAVALTLSPRPASAAPAACGKLEPATVAQSLALGTRFLLQNQRPAGNFIYAYDWRKRELARDDSDVRQAGASWGVALLYLHQPSDATLAAARRALRFFARHSQLNRNGARFIVYPASRHGSLGTVALVALAHIELLRAGVKDPELSQHLNQYLRLISQAHRQAGRFHSRYRHDNGKPYGQPSSYFDGEALLAWVKAARYLGRDDLLAPALSEVEAAHTANVAQALAADPDSSITKGYYQWSSMSYYELATWERTRANPRHGDRLLALADWMVDVHRTLARPRNTAYAYEGLVPAYALARQRKDHGRAKRLACVINQGLNKLTSWQVGGPLPNAHITAAAVADPRALGGVQNHAREPLLRIDVTQHQMHALLLARQLYLVAPP